LSLELQGCYRANEYTQATVTIDDFKFMLSAAPLLQELHLTSRKQAHGGAFLDAIVTGPYATRLTSLMIDNLPDERESLITDCLERFSSLTQLRHLKLPQVSTSLISSLINLTSLSFNRYRMEKVVDDSFLHVIQTLPSLITIDEESVSSWIHKQSNKRKSDEEDEDEDNGVKQKAEEVNDENSGDGDE
jgi:hypothetical protein